MVKFKFPIESPKSSASPTPIIMLHNVIFERTKEIECDPLICWMLQSYKLTPFHHIKQQMNKTK